jgi:hypothetical protein
MDRRKKLLNWVVVISCFASRLTRLSRTGALPILIADYFPTVFRGKSDMIFAHPFRTRKTNTCICHQTTFLRLLVA